MKYRMNENSLIGKHDLSLPEWGPYSKKYFGISHIADKKNGIRFDLSLVPGLYRRDLNIPNVKKESGYTPWEVSGDLEYYSYRQQIVPKDEVYCQVSFSKVNDSLRLIRCESVNNSDMPVSLSFHVLAMLEFPFPSPYMVTLPENADWLDATENEKLEFAKPRFNDTLVTDARRRGEVFESKAVSGRCIDGDFGKDKGDRIYFNYNGKNNAVVLLRYKIEKGKSLKMTASGTVNTNFELSGTGNYEQQLIFTGNIQPGVFCLQSSGGQKVSIDGIAICKAGMDNKVSFKNCDWNSKAIMEDGPLENSVMLSYKDIPHKYFLWWSNSRGISRSYSVDSIDDTLIYNDAVHQHFMRDIEHGGDEHCNDITIQPVSLDPGQKDVSYMLVGDFDNTSSITNLLGTRSDISLLEDIYNRTRATAYLPATSEAGSKYLFSQQLMSAVLLSNVVFPTYVKNSFVRHHTPGRCWDSLYTWDSGFIGLGLLEMDIDRAVENLNAYVTEPDDPEAAFVHHGSPVPIQHYLYLDIWNRTGDRELLEFFYPRLKRYYDFLAGHSERATTRKLKSNLLKTWDYFYNSGGWDDYPPQLEIAHSPDKSITPVISSAQTIRIAKILRFAAEELGVDDDIVFFDRDIEAFSKALREYSWDAESGYYSYVRHDRDGNPGEIFRHSPSNTNYNMGMDGLTPLVAGICDHDQKELMFGRLESPERFWTDIGLSTVDMSAPYYRSDGYWNGSVWMPHQWFFWKTALNEGRGDFAWKIASTALNLWQRETNDTYYCFEHFTIESGRGGGWHHFGGLSAPVLSWFGAYFRQDRLTVGFDVWIKKAKRAARSYEYMLSICGQPDEVTTLILVVGSGEYAVTYNEHDVEYKIRIPGTLEINLPKASSGCLKVTKTIA